MYDPDQVRSVVPLEPLLRTPHERIINILPPDFHPQHRRPLNTLGHYSLELAAIVRIDPHTVEQT